MSILDTRVKMGHRFLPWQTVGKELTNEVRSAKQALRETGLDWHVTQAPAYAHHNGGFIPLDEAYVNVKVDKNGYGTPLGVVGKRYKVIQNQEMFGVLDEVANSGEARYAAAGEVGGGKVVYVVMKLPRGVKITGDPHEAYMLARTSHNGSTALEITTVLNRVACTNQINGLFHQNRKDEGRGVYTVRHTTNAVVEAVQVRQMLNIVYDEIDLYESFADRALNTTWNDMRFERYLEKVFPLPKGVTETMREEFLDRGQKIARTRSLNNRERAWESWLNKTKTMEHITQTAFGAFQAVIETYDHLAVSNENKRAQQTILSGDTDKKFRAYYLLGV